MSSDTKAQKIGIEDARREIAGGDATAVDVRSEEEWSAPRRPGSREARSGEIRDGRQLGG